jgi:C-terminal processing protease CtpA/Prc
MNHAHPAEALSCLIFMSDGAAERSGLHPGDQLLSINSINVADQTHQAVVTIIQQGVPMLPPVQTSSFT